MRYWEEFFKNIIFFGVRYFVNSEVIFIIDIYLLVLKMVLFFEEKTYVDNNYKKLNFLYALFYRFYLIVIFYYFYFDI